MTDEELMTLMLRVDPLTKRIPPGVRAIDEAIEVELAVVDPAKAMQLADNYASAQYDLDEAHSTNRKYYLEIRDNARAELARYLSLSKLKLRVAIY